MVRLIVGLVVLLGMLAPPVQAQTTDQLNKLSLEALTAEPPRGAGPSGYAPTPHRAPAYRGRFAPGHFAPRYSHSGRATAQHPPHGSRSMLGHSVPPYHSGPALRRPFHPGAPQLTANAAIP